MDSDDAQMRTSRRQQDRPPMFCLRESQGDSQPHAPMQEWLTCGSQNQSSPGIPQTPITISHTSTDGKHDHHQPRRLVQQKMTYNNPPTNRRRWPQYNLALTHQQSLSRPMHNWMGPLPPRTHCQDLEMSNHPLLLQMKTGGSPFQPNTLGPQNNWPSMDNLLHHLALQKWRTYGKNYEEQWIIALRTTRESVRCIYHQSKDQVPEEDSNTLHAQPIKEVMKWMKRHLDAYLATAEVYLEQNVDPG
jgi:hypothetical protein